ncbi:MAG: 3-deoxy-D-manno-octulosonic acid transferase [Deltaproteobacteria bacterium]|nr:MAG: 3-deoxy-D-manno-octulosonic acid transferase [Deltaproteobacteria bacterium]
MTGGILASAELGLYRGVVSAVRMGAAVYVALARGSSGRQIWSERLGNWPPVAAEPAPLWIHAASVGETGVAHRLIPALRERTAGAPILLTCNTGTARSVAESAGLAGEVRYFPLDHARVIRSILAARRPRAALVVETEIWPVLLTELARAGIPAAMVNARVSRRSYPSYRAVRPLIASALGTLGAVCARDETSCARLIALGAPVEKCRCTGDIKLDGLAERADREVSDLLAEFGRERPTVIAASTHEGEDAIVLDAYRRVRARVPEVRLVLAPRHPERCPSVVRMAGGGDLAVHLRSQAGGRTSWDVLVVDTVGELVGFMKGAASVFVGGSLVRVGGHNLMEPAAFGVPVACGPELDTVREQADALEAASALSLVRNAEELARVWAHWLEHPEIAQARGRRGREVVEAGSGAVERTVAMLEECGVL